jgi:DNA-binding response OmpR family regulator
LWSSQKKQLRVVTEDGRVLKKSVTEPYATSRFYAIGLHTPRLLAHFILLDLNLSDMSGFEVLRSLGRSKVRTPILVLTGLAGID